MVKVCKFDVEGKGFDESVFDYVFLQAVIGISRNLTSLGITENATILDIIRNLTELGITE